MKSCGVHLSTIFFCSLILVQACANNVATTLDTPASIIELQKARQLAGNDQYLQITQRLQCREIDRDGVPTGPQDSTVEGDVEPLKVLDNLYFIGGPSTAGWLFATSDGYILLDAMYGDSPEETILPNMKKLGLDPALIKYILITHAGPDHAGGAKYFQENYGTQVIMSQGDWDSLLNPQPGAWVLRVAAGQVSPASKNWRGPPTKDLVGVDGQTLTLGDTTVTMVSTPRRVDGGGLSYIIPVTVNGTPHMFSSYGNTNIVGTIADKKIYRKAVKHWLEYTDAMNIDIVLSSHPFVDGSLQRMKKLRNLQAREPNPFIIGKQAARRYFDILDQCAAVAIKRAEAGLDITGTRRID